MIASLKFWTLFIGIGAVVGAVMMWYDPVGMVFGMQSLLEMLRDKMPIFEPLLRNFIPSGFVLLAVNGITQFYAAYLLFKKKESALRATLVCGIILMLWIVLEWWAWGFNYMSNIYFVFGLIEAATALICIKREQRLRSLS